MIRIISNWINKRLKQIEAESRLRKGVAARCDECKEIVSGWFGSEENGIKKRICMKCARKLWPNDPLVDFTEDHISELVTGEESGKYITIASSDDKE